MKSIKLSHQSLITLKRYALLVLFICYIPHITTQPAWLFVLFLAAIGYRVIADYYSTPPLPWWVRLGIVSSCLFLLSGNIFSSGFFIRFLVAFVVLKCVELNTTRDLKVLILCNFLLMFSALIVTQDLWIIIYLFVAIFSNLALMIKLSAPEVSLSQITSKSGQQLLIVIPLSILLFYVFPRIDPLWKVPSMSKVSTGLDEKMMPGSVAGLFYDDSTVMQITFKKNPILRGYWREMILNFFNGQSWYPSLYSYSGFSILSGLKANEVADYDILLEPTQKKWLFYDGYPMAGKPTLLFSPNHGLVRTNKENIIKRFSYAIKVQLAPYRALSSDERTEATQLPGKINPRLSAWAKEQFAKANQDPKVFIDFLRQYIHEQSFWYTLTPPSLMASENQMDTFWFESQKGFCEHYASAVTFILRSAGIPSRIILGYYGGKWNPITNSITIPQNSAHAWLEYWQEGTGWRQLDPTSFIASTRIDKTIQTRDSYFSSQGGYASLFEAPWRQKISLLIDSARFYSERWFFLYNQTTQQNLLQNMGLGKWSAEELLQAFVSLVPLLFILIGLYYHWQQKRSLDPLLVEYHLLQNEFRRLHVATHPSATLKQQCESIIEKVPALHSTMNNFMLRYEQLRLMGSVDDEKANKKQVILLFKKLRSVLRAEYA